MNRPASIVNFERFYLARIIIGLVASALTWNTMVTAASAAPGAEKMGANFMPTVMGGTLVLVLAIDLLLWYFTARKGEVVAKWIIVAFFVLSVLGWVFALAKGTFAMNMTGAFSAVDFVLGAASVWFLFQPDARVWFGETKAP